MNEELTDDMIEDACKCDGQIACCNCKNKTNKFCVSACVTRFAQALKAEKAKQKDDIWKDAPKWAVTTRRTFGDGNGRSIYSKTTTRELPKTKARLIAEELVGKIPYEAGSGVVYTGRENLIDSIEKAIIEAQGTK